MEIVSRFIENAARIFEAAEMSPRDGFAPTEWTVLIGSGGGISMLAESDWPLDSLQADRGARMAYRVSRHSGRVTVEGRDGPRTCLFQAEKPGNIARRLLADQPRYLLEDSPVTSARLPAGSARLLPAASG